MRLTLATLAAALICALAWSQESRSTSVEIVDEPHHTLLLQNPEVRVFRLKLQPNEVTLPHRHKSFYAYLSLRPVTIGNEVRGRQPVVTDIEAAELHTSKGGFTVAERNNSSEAADLLVIEAMKAGERGFNTPMGGFRFHDAAFGAIFEAPAIRGYTMTIAAEGRTEEHAEPYDRLLVAVSDLKLRENVAGQPPSELQMKAGEIRWIPRGMTHATTNIGKAPATFITLEFE
jgi:hypothetical protein